MSWLRVPRAVAGAAVSYARIGWWGGVAPSLTERHRLVVVQAVIERDGQVLLAIRGDLRGWELPGGTPEPAESDEQALRREIHEETGLEVEGIERVGDYVRTGFRPHTARVFRCRSVPGAVASAGPETRGVRWFAPEALPETLFPWYREPLADAMNGASEPIERREHQGLSAILAGLQIDWRMRMKGDELA